MSKQVPWTRRLLDEFYKSAVLNSEEIFIMENRVLNKPVSWMASELHCSESKIHKMIAELKRKYDRVQAENPELPPRKASKQEAWMDKN